jgi:signal transduction histidine kinase
MPAYTRDLSYAQDLSLRINDNGTGIDPDILQRGRQGHVGLHNMRERAARIMGKLDHLSHVSM